LPTKIAAQMLAINKACGQQMKAAGEIRHLRFEH